MIQNKKYTKIKFKKFIIAKSPNSIGYLDDKRNYGFTTLWIIFKIFTIILMFLHCPQVHLSKSYGNE